MVQKAYRFYGPWQLSVVTTVHAYVVVEESKRSTQRAGAMNIGAAEGLNKADRKEREVSTRAPPYPRVTSSQRWSVLP